jgi:hypothetical protein
MQRRAQVRQEKAQAKAQKALRKERRTGEVTAAPAWTPEEMPAAEMPARAAPRPPAAAPAHHDVEDELARLKREMGAS